MASTTHCASRTLIAPPLSGLAGQGLAKHLRAELDAHGHRHHALDVGTRHAVEQAVAGRHRERADGAPNDRVQQHDRFADLAQPQDAGQDQRHQDAHGLQAHQQTPRIDPVGGPAAHQQQQQHRQLAEHQRETETVGRLAQLDRQQIGQQHRLDARGDHERGDAAEVPGGAARCWRSRHSVFIPKVRGAQRDGAGSCAETGASATEYMERISGTVRSGAWRPDRIRASRAAWPAGVAVGWACRDPSDDCPPCPPP
jgi:hypothetical protein